MTTTENHDQQKAQISFKTITLTKKILVLRNTRPQELNQEIFLSNISYVGISKEDFYNQNFVFDIYALITKNLNLFPLERKLWDLNKHEIILLIFISTFVWKGNFFTVRGKTYFIQRCQKSFVNLYKMMKKIQQAQE